MKSMKASASLRAPARSPLDIFRLMLACVLRANVSRSPGANRATVSAASCSGLGHERPAVKLGENGGSVGNGER